MAEIPREFAELFEQYYKPILNYALRRTGHVETARDIASQTFFNAYRKFHQFRWEEGSSFSSWVYRIATNEVNSHYRKGKGALSLDVIMESGFDVPSQDDLQHELIEAQDRLQRSKDFLRIREAMSRLPVKYQEALALRYFEGKKIQEIAEILGKREGTVKALLSRGTDKLKRACQEVEPQPFLGNSIEEDEGRKLII
jgi:RNA polymerase sigma-70 factor, ECF subfamily